MHPYVFPGSPVFVRQAAEELDAPGSVPFAAPNPALIALANLCAQAALADPGRVATILAHAAGFRDQLRTALRAADLMIAHVEEGRAAPAGDGEPTPAEIPAPPPRVRDGRPARGAR